MTVRPVYAMGASFALCIPLAIWLAAPFMQTAPALPQEPTAANNALFLTAALVFVAMVVGMAVFVLWAVRTGRVHLLLALVHGAVGIASLVILARPALWAQPYLGPDLPWILALVVAVAVSVLSYRRTTQRFQNTLGILVAASVAALTGAMLGVLPLLFLLVAIAVYDLVAVRRTKHMQKLARAAQDLRLPLALQWGAASPKPDPRTGARVATTSATNAARPPGQTATAKPGNRPSKPAKTSSTRPDGEQLFMGLGDLVFPTALVVAAADPRQAWGALPAVAASLGVMAGYFLLVRQAARGGAQPGLPLLNGGAILGFFVGLLAGTGRLAL